MKLIWESEEWDPVREEEGGWSVSEEDADDSHADGYDEEERRLQMIEKRRKKKENKDRDNNNEGWKRRETELVDGTRAVGFFIEESKEARVRVELR